jgi:hypothetical protein
LNSAVQLIDFWETHKFPFTTAALTLSYVFWFDHAGHLQLVSACESPHRDRSNQNWMVRFYLA